MTQAITRSVLVPYSAREMYELVCDVARYREFLPGCISSELLAAGEAEVIGRMAFTRLGMTQHMISRNRLTPPSRIDIEHVEGPFEHLKAHWQFDALQEKACKVTFSMEFAVGQRFVQFAVGAAVQQGANDTVEAFRKRAEQIYGKR